LAARKKSTNQTKEKTEGKKKRCKAPCLLAYLLKHAAKVRSDSARGWEQWETEKEKEGKKERERKKKKGSFVHGLQLQAISDSS
jgi:hypothetical protein